MFSKNTVLNRGKKMLQKLWSQADMKSHLKTLNVLLQYEITQLLLDVWAIYFRIYIKTSVYDFHGQKKANLKCFVVITKSNFNEHQVS